MHCFAEAKEDINYLVLAALMLRDGNLDRAVVALDQVALELGVDPAVGVAAGAFPEQADDLVVLPAGEADHLAQEVHPPADGVGVVLRPRGQEPLDLATQLRGAALVGVEDALFFFSNAKRMLPAAAADISSSSPLVGRALRASASSCIGP